MANDVSLLNTKEVTAIPELVKIHFVAEAVPLPDLITVHFPVTVQVGQGKKRRGLIEVGDDHLEATFGYFAAHDEWVGVVAVITVISEGRRSGEKTDNKTGKK